LSKTKPYIIPKKLVMEAYQRVKANKGAAGVDQQSLENFELNLKNNLYKIWNRMSSGTYFPPPVKAVPIPKKTGGERILGVPTVADRIAQMVVKLTFEPCVEPHFHDNSYGYRPNKSAIDAVGVTQKRCWKYDFVLEFDIKGLFDNINHSLLLKAVKKHTDNPWVILYIERWLTTPMQMPDGTLLEKTRGTMQGGVTSPVLSNLFLHYVFDVWMGKHHPGKPWCRYADDGLLHLKSEREAQAMLVSIKQRFSMCELELHPEKTRIVYCKDGKRRKQYPETQFTFLGYDFRARRSFNSKTHEVFQNFSPAVSKKATQSMREHIRASDIRNRSDLSLEEIANKYNPILNGWIGYYGHYNRTALESVMVYFNKTLTAWAMRKYKTLKSRKTKASNFIHNVQKKNPHLFSHWKHGLGSGFA
jgi:RNA-directed DNA polymerase